MPLGIEPPLFRRRADWFRQTRAFTIDKAVRELGFVARVPLAEGSGARRSGTASTRYLRQPCAASPGVFEFRARPGDSAPRPRGDGEGDRAPRAPTRAPVFQDGPIGLQWRGGSGSSTSRPLASQPVPNEDGTIQLV